MFKGAQSNPYEELVVKTTDENLTSENWELILNICDKVQDEREAGARNVIAAVLRRLAHRNPNVQLYALALVEALSKNCGDLVNREVASRSFTQGLERIVTDRTTHDKVKRKVLSLIYMWTAEFESDPTLGIMEECYENLRSKGYKFEEPSEPPPPQVDDEIRRREEEELQRVLEMSVHDKGGRSAWQSYGNDAPNGAGPSSSSFSSGTSRTADVPVHAAPTHYNADYGYAKTTGHVPGRTPSPKAQSPAIPSPTSALPGYSAASGGAGGTESSSQTSLPLTSVSRVRALHNFEGTEQGELTFEKGDIIKVVDRNYKDWWRGQLKGRTGIFPVNYVELLPDPTPEEIAREAEQEAAIFAQAANIDKLLNMLRGLDPAKDSLADNEEIQELYRQSMTLRPKIVKLIDKYSQKRAELVSMNETFIKARAIFDRVMEESLARHSSLYEGAPFAAVTPRQDYRSPGYGQPFEQSFARFAQPSNAGYSSATPTPSTQPYVATAYPTQRPPYGPYSTQQATSPYASPQAQATPEGNAPYGPYQQSPVGQPQAGAPPQGHGAPQPYNQQPPQPVARPQQTQQHPQAHPVSPQPQVQQTPGTSQVSAQPQAQVNGYQEPASSQPSAIAQAQVQPQGQTGNVITQGPPYVFDPNATYPDFNAQAWAQYYAAGGDDPTGAVYFISVPGVTDRQPQQPGTDQAQPQQEQQQQSQPGRRVSGGAVSNGQTGQTPGSPTGNRTSFYQQYSGQQASAYPQAQGQPATNGSAVSLDASQGQGYFAPQQPAGASQQFQTQPQSSGGSPTQPRLTRGGGSFYASGQQQQQPSPQAQPSSPGAIGIQESQSGPGFTHQPYPSNAVSDPTAATLATSPSVGGISSPAQHEPTGYDINTQYTQMHGQFAAMGIGEPRSPSAVAPALHQTA